MMPTRILNGRETSNRGKNLMRAIRTPVNRFWTMSHRSLFWLQGAGVTDLLRVEEQEEELL